MSENVPLLACGGVAAGGPYETRWILTGPTGRGGFHCTNLAILAWMREETEMPDLWRSGGVEYHHRAAPDYMAGEDATHEHCWILGGPCWHDGTSLWASEHWIPLLEAAGEDAIWRDLRATYERHDWPAGLAKEGLVNGTALLVLPGRAAAGPLRRGRGADLAGAPGASALLALSGVRERDDGAGAAKAALPLFEADEGA